MLVGVAERCSGSVRICSPLPGRLKERLSGRRWVLDYVDRGQGLQRVSTRALAVALGQHGAPVRKLRAPC